MFVAVSAAFSFDYTTISVYLVDSTNVNTKKSITTLSAGNSITSVYTLPLSQIDDRIVWQVAIRKNKRIRMDVRELSKQVAHRFLWSAKSQCAPKSARLVLVIHILRELMGNLFLRSLVLVYIYKMQAM